MNPSSELTYRPAWWVPGAHAQTLWGKLFRRQHTVPTRAERLTTPDGDEVELQRLEGDPTRPRLVLLHGLEGTIRSHYIQGVLRLAQRAGWCADVLIFRSCDGRPNRAQRLYHSGETTDLDLVLRHLKSESPDQLIVAAGFSLGGNVLLKWLGEQGESASALLRAAAAVSVPFDLERGSRHIEAGFSRVYGRHFLVSLKAKADAKWQSWPGAFDRDAARSASTLFEFDDAVTAPVHGFLNAHDYYSRSSSRAFLKDITLPTLLLSALDDPFLPPGVLDDVRMLSLAHPNLSFEFPVRGGHVGFVSGVLPWRPVYYAEHRVLEFLASAAGVPAPFRT